MSAFLTDMAMQPDIPKYIAGVGAKRLLLNVDERARAMVADMRYIELPTHADGKRSL